MNRRRFLLGSILAPFAAMFAKLLPTKSKPVQWDSNVAYWFDKDGRIWYISDAELPSQWRIHYSQVSEPEEWDNLSRVWRIDSVPISSRSFRIPIQIANDSSTDRQ